jgi:hypothetical protein
LLLPHGPAADVLADAIAARAGAAPQDVEIVRRDAPSAELAAALARLLSVERVEEDVLRFGRLQGRPRPLIVPIAAAAELTDVGPLERTIGLLQRELRRTCLGNDVLPLVYLGRVGGRLPADGVVRRLAALTGVRRTVVLDDSDACGSRHSFDRVVAAAARFTATLAVSDRLQEATQAEETSCLATGVLRIDVSPQAAGAVIERELRRRIGRILFGKSVSQANSGDGPPTSRAEDRAFVELQSAATTLTAARWLDKERRNRRLLESLKPSSRTPWWVRLWRRLLACLALLVRPMVWLLRRDAVATPPPIDVAPQPTSDELLRRLGTRDQQAQAIAWLRATLLPRQDGAPRGHGAGDVAWLDVPGFRERYLAPIDAELTADARAVAACIGSAGERAKHDGSLEALAAWVDRLVRRAASRRRAALAGPDDFRRLLQCAEQAVTPLFSGEGGAVRTLAFVPRSFFDAVERRDDVSIGRDGELLVVAIQADVSPASLLGESIEVE